MFCICPIFVLFALALAGPIPRRNQLRHGGLPAWPVTPESFVEDEYQIYGRETNTIRGATTSDLVDAHIALDATLTNRKPSSMQSSVKQTDTRPTLNTSPSPSSDVHQQSRWSPSVISNVFFGCITSILGVVTVAVTYFLHRQRPESDQADGPAELDDTSTSRAHFSGEAQPLQDLTPSYTYIDGAPAGENQDGTNPPVAPEETDRNSI